MQLVVNLRGYSVVAYSAGKAIKLGNYEHHGMFAFIPRMPKTSRVPNNFTCKSYGFIEGSMRRKKD